MHPSPLTVSSSRVFVSPVQPALLPGSPRIDGFHSLDYPSHRVVNKAECPKEQTHQLGSQLSNTPYYADSPKRHETVIIEKTKRTQHIITNNVATLAKPPPWFDGRTIRSIAIGRHGSRSTSTYPPLSSTTYSRGRRSTTRQSAPNWTSLSRGGNSTARQTANNLVQVAAQQHQPLLHLSLSTNGGVTYSYSSSGTTSRAQENRQHAAWNSIEETYGTINTIICQEELLYEELANILQTTWCIMEEAPRPSSRHGGECSPRTFRNACAIWTDPRRLKSRPGGGKR